MARASTTVGSAGDYLGLMTNAIRALDADAIDRLAGLVFDAWRDDRQVFVFGNGGSAAIASHYVTDFVKTAAVEGRRRLRCISLVDNVPMLTAIGNDFDYDSTISYPLESYAKARDVAIAISGSGTSKNIVKACNSARAKDLLLVALTGFDGGAIGEMADIHINVACDNYGVIEDLHQSICHVVTQALQARVAASADA